MKAQERRKAIANMLSSATTPVSGAELSELFSVSRQIIVSDISVLKASGFDILSTHYGYVMSKSPLSKRVFKVFHTTEQTEDELRTIIDLGGTVVDVFVWHKAYGKVQAQLNIFSRERVEQFIDSIRSGKSSELMHITGGYHYHTIEAESNEILDKIEKALSDKNYIAPEI